MLRTRVVMERGGGQWSEGAGAHFWLGTCHAFSSSRGLSGRGPGRGGPHRPHHAPPPDQKACTLGRRPDIFNGDAARILGQQPQTAQQQLPDQPARAPAARSPAAVLPATPAPAATHGLASASAAASTLVLTPSSADPASAAALWCDQLRRLHRTATATQRRLDGLLRDLDTLELGTGPELRAAERLGKVLATYLSFAFPGAMEPPEEPGTSLARPGMSSSSSTTGSSSSSSSSGSGSSRDSSSKGWAFHGAHRASGREQQQPVAPESSVGHLRSLLARVEAAAAQLADIGRRHEAGAYAPLRRFYFSPDEPLQAISLRSEQYRRQLEGAAVACGPDSPEVANLVEEVAAALSSHTVAAFLELELEGLGEVQGQARGEAAAADTVAGTDASSGDAGDAAEDSGGGSLERLAVAAAADYYSLQELRQELEVVGRSAEAAGVPVGQLLRLADLER